MTEEKLPPFFYDIFDASLPRLGPGDDASTSKALDILLAVEPAPDGDLRILDIGCGNGTPTIQVARRTSGTITAIDNHQPFLDELQRRAKLEGFSERIQVRHMDMRELGTEMGTFDLIWSEGALSLMGFGEGLAACRSLLATGGRLAVTELCWLRPDPPPECRSFFETAYPPMVDVPANLAIIRNAQLEVVDHFTLPESAWRDSYCAPLEERVRTLRARYPGDPERMEMLDSIQEEIDLYRKYSSYYGYVFYLMRRP